MKRGASSQGNNDNGRITKSARPPENSVHLPDFRSTVDPVNYAIFQLHALGFTLEQCMQINTCPVPVQMKLIELFPDWSLHFDHTQLTKLVTEGNGLKNLDVLMNCYLDLHYSGYTAEQIVQKIIDDPDSPELNLAQATLMLDVNQIVNQEDLPFSPFDEGGLIPDLPAGQRNSDNPPLQNAPVPEKVTNELKRCGIPESLYLSQKQQLLSLKYTEVHADNIILRSRSSIIVKKIIELHHHLIEYFNRDQIVSIGAYSNGGDRNLRAVSKFLKLPNMLGFTPAQILEIASRTQGSNRLEAVEKYDPSLHCFGFDTQQTVDMVICADGVKKLALIDAHQAILQEFNFTADQILRLFLVLRGDWKYLDALNECQIVLKALRFNADEIINLYCKQSGLGKVNSLQKLIDFGFPYDKITQIDNKCTLHAIEKLIELHPAWSPYFDYSQITNLVTEGDGLKNLDLLMKCHLDLRDSGYTGEQVVQMIIDDPDAYVLEMAQANQALMLDVSQISYLGDLPFDPFDKDLFTPDLPGSEGNFAIAESSDFPVAGAGLAQEQVTFQDDPNFLTSAFFSDNPLLQGATVPDSVSATKPQTENIFSVEATALTEMSSGIPLKSADNNDDDIVNVQAPLIFTPRHAPIQFLSLEDESNEKSANNFSTYHLG